MIQTIAHLIVGAEITVIIAIRIGEVIIIEIIKGGEAIIGIIVIREGIIMTADLKGLDMAETGRKCNVMPATSSDI